MRSAVTLRVDGDWHVEAPFVVALPATHPDADRTTGNGCSGHKGHTGKLLAAWTSDWKLLAVTNGVGHDDVHSLLQW